MSYESPIEFIYNEVVPEIEMKQEEMVMQAVMQCGVVVKDADELVKALKYDRDQYNAGAKDAMRHACKAMAKYCAEHCYYTKYYYSRYKDVDEVMEHLEKKCENCPLGEF